MAKNYKERASYSYLHETHQVRGKLLNSVLKKFRRWNFDISWYKERRLKKIEQEINKIQQEQYEEYL